MIKIIFGILGGIVAIFLLSIVIYLPFVISDALKKNRDKCEYLLILGGNIIGADTPSPQLMPNTFGTAPFFV